MTLSYFMRGDNMAFLTVPLILLVIFFFFDEWVGLVLFLIWLLAGYPNIATIQGWVQGLFSG